MSIMILSMISTTQENK
ncbi:hypothetical protein [Salmonella enterica]|nr:hypothetical protein [Salmonella enterica]